MWLREPAAQAYKRGGRPRAAHLTPIPQVHNSRVTNLLALKHEERRQRWLPRWSAPSSWSSFWRLTRAMPRCCRPLAAASTAATASPNVAPHGTARPSPRWHHLLCRPPPLLSRLARSWPETRSKCPSRGLRSFSSCNLYLCSCMYDGNYSLDTVIKFYAHTPADPLLLLTLAAPPP
jgi:uncharacterized membrane protein YbaN (DUF454 family)